MITCNPKEGETDTLFVPLLDDREVIWQTRQQANIKQISPTRNTLMGYDIIVDLEKEFSTSTKQLPNHFLSMKPKFRSILV